MEIKEVIQQLESLLNEAQYNGLSICHDDGYACDYETETDSCRFNDLVRSIVDGRE